MSRVRVVTAGAVVAGVVAGALWLPGLLAGGDAATEVAAPVTELPRAPDSLGPTTGSPDANRETLEGPPIQTGISTAVALTDGTDTPRTGRLVPLEEAAAVGGRWMPQSWGPTFPEASTGWGLTYDGSAWSWRGCGDLVTAPGTVSGGRISLTGAVTTRSVDGGVDCAVFDLTSDWVRDVLRSSPRVWRDGNLLVVQASVGDDGLVDVGVPMTSDDAVAGAALPAQLASTWVEVPADEAGRDVGAQSWTDPQPDRRTTLSVRDGVVELDVGCDEPLRGPAWLRPADIETEPEHQILAAALGAPVSRATQSGCEGAAASDAEMWATALARGVSVHRSGEYLVIDGWAHPALIDGWRQLDGMPHGSRW